MKSCLYIGSFDPFHNGHLNLIKKLSQDYDQVYVLITRNYIKKPRVFDEKDMRKAINEVLHNEKIYNAQCLEASRYAQPAFLCKQLGCDCICRGLYKKEDERFEIFLKKINELLGAKTIIYPNEITISSTQVKKEFFAGNDISNLVPKEVIEIMQKHLIQNQVEVV